MSDAERSDQVGVPRSAAQRVIGDFAPQFVSLTDDVLFGQVWTRSALTPRDRSLVTIASLVAGGTLDTLPAHLRRGLDNGLTQTEIIEAMTHLAFYSGWPKASAALVIAKGLWSQ